MHKYHTECWQPRSLLGGSSRAHCGLHWLEQAATQPRDGERILAKFAILRNWA
jgi:hypothetical protein